jgi:hypothetical protein
MAPHADTLHLGEQQVGEIECAGASKDVYDDSVKVADIPVQVPQTTVVNEHDHDNKHYTKDCQEIFDEKSRADTPMMEIDPQIAMDLVFAPTCTDEEQSEIYMMTKPSNSLSDKVCEVMLYLHVTLTILKLILEPYRYLSSLPGKGIRNITIDAFNVWLKAPESSTNIIKSAIGMLHSSSLMLDDLEDGSPLRRGKPSTHVVFGAATTINSATFLFIKVINELKALRCPAAIDLYTEEMHNLFVGQSYDGYWTNTLACPTVEEYIQMIDGKTGGLFRLSISLLAACSTRQITVDLKMSLAHLCCLIGRYFQIRDDYQNLASPDVGSSDSHRSRSDVANMY